MNNFTILSNTSGSDQLRKLLRNVVAIRPSSDPMLCTPLGEEFALGTTRGKSRDSNEDRGAIMRVFGSAGDAPWMMLAVCDGIGGMVDGARAAEIALSAFLSTAVTSHQGPCAQNLMQSARSANAAVFKEFRGRGGATLAAVAWDSVNLVTVNVGDSRIWGLRQAELEQWTQDDSIAAQLKAKGLQGAESASRDLLQYVGVGDEISPHIESPRLDGVRAIILTTDGAHDAPAEVIARIAKHASNAGEFVERTIELSLWLGGLDNASVAYLRPVKVPRGDAGVVELWVPGGYWRVVRADSTPTEPVSPRPVAVADAKPTGKDTQVGKSNQRKSKLRISVKRDYKRGQRRRSTPPPSPLFGDTGGAERSVDDSLPPIPEPGHVQIDIESKSSRDEAEGSVRPETKTGKEVK